QITSRENKPANEPDGYITEDGRIWGTYIHGLFENDGFRKAWLASIDMQSTVSNFGHERAAAYDRLADVLESSLNISMLDSIISTGVT
ncbi:MAG: cobyric acid synthase CobQ, partial [Leptolinea sp.]|nr:cobyric acid synthase CobQ [Leptolinea sp.]